MVGIYSARTRTTKTKKKERRQGENQYNKQHNQDQHQSDQQFVHILRTDLGNIVRAQGPNFSTPRGIAHTTAGSGKGYAMLRKMGKRLPAAV